MDRVKVLLLWYIRENNPIQVKDLLTKIQSDRHKLTQWGFGERELYTLVGHEATFILSELVENGLVRAKDSSDQPLHGRQLRPDSVLSAAPNLPYLQHFFDISLLAILHHPGEFMRAFPHFGKPLPKTSKWAQVFVMMPFLPELKPIYDDHILKVTQSLNLSCKRGDDFFSANSILDEIWSSIYHADICIAECSQRNPNVFYEIGIAHTLGRKTILITQSMGDVPFDVSTMRVIDYVYPTAMPTFEEKLRKTLSAELGLTPP